MTSHSVELRPYESLIIHNSTVEFHSASLIEYRTVSMVFVGLAHSEHRVLRTDTREFLQVRKFSYLGHLRYV